MEITWKTYLKHLALFLLTFASSTLVGMFYCGYADTWQGQVTQGLSFSVPFILFLACHEMGHYYFARKYGVQASLPYFIPLPFLSPVGTLGAIIVMRSQAPTRRQMFDIGVAGPLAGLVIGMAALFIAIATFPDRDFVYNFHPDYKEIEASGKNYKTEAIRYEYWTKMDSLHFLESLSTFKEDSLEVEKHNSSLWGKFAPMPLPSKTYQRKEQYDTPVVGTNLLFMAVKKIIGEERFPANFEMMHYPILMAAFWALFFTALNLFPLGQLDGGHVTYGLFGPKIHLMISRITFLAMVLFGGMGLLTNNIFEINIFTSGALDIFLLVGGYFFLLTRILKNIFQSEKNIYFASIVIIAIQFFTELIVPGFKGVSLFAIVLAFLIGRTSGIHHPIAMVEDELDTKRKVLGWIALAVFVLCFIPYPLDDLTITP